MYISLDPRTLVPQSANDAIHLRQVQSIKVQIPGYEIEFDTNAKFQKRHTNECIVIANILGIFVLDQEVNDNVGRPIRIHQFYVLLHSAGHSWMEDGESLLRQLVDYQWYHSWKPRHDFSAGIKISVV